MVAMDTSFLVHRLYFFWADLDLNNVHFIPLMLSLLFTLSPSSRQHFPLPTHSLISMAGSHGRLDQISCLVQV